MEFDLYEDARRHLTKFLISEGCKDLDAERIALYIVQGIRAVPKLLSILNKRESSSPEIIRAALHAVLENAPAFEKARAMLSTTSD